MSEIIGNGVFAGGSNLVPDTCNLALESGVSYNGRIVKFGPTVTVCGSFNYPDTYSRRLLAILPSGFRPIGTVHFIAGNGNAAFSSTEIMIKSDGEIWLDPYLSYNQNGGTYAYLDAMFFTSDTTYPLTYDSSKITVSDGAIGVYKNMCFAYAKFSAASSEYGWRTNVITIPEGLYPENRNLCPSVTSKYPNISSSTRDYHSYYLTHRDTRYNANVNGINIFMNNLDISGELYLSANWITN